MGVETIRRTVGQLDSRLVLSTNGRDERIRAWLENIRLGTSRGHPITNGGSNTCAALPPKRGSSAWSPCWIRWFH